MRPTETRPRNRPAYALSTIVVIALGLLSRKEARYLPSPLGKDVGDVLYALMAFLVLAALFSRSSTVKVGMAALLCCVLVEVSKLRHLPVLVAFRSTQYNDRAFTARIWVFLEQSDVLRHRSLHGRDH